MKQPRGTSCRVLARAGLLLAGACAAGCDPKTSVAPPPKPPTISSSAGTPEQASGARVQTRPSTEPTTAPGPVTYKNAEHGVQFSYPSGWTPKKDPDYVLLLVPVKDAAG